jgi:hypothetical protein
VLVRTVVAHRGGPRFANTSPVRLDLPSLVSRLVIRKTEIVLMLSTMMLFILKSTLTVEAADSALEGRGRYPPLLPTRRNLPNLQLAATPYDKYPLLWRWFGKCCVALLLCFCKIDTTAFV